MVNHKPMRRNEARESNLQLFILDLILSDRVLMPSQGRVCLLQCCFYLFKVILVLGILLIQLLIPSFQDYQLRADLPLPFVCLDDESFGARLTVGKESIGGRDLPSSLLEAAVSFDTG